MEGSLLYWEVGMSVEIRGMMEICGTLTRIPGRRPTYTSILLETAILWVPWLRRLNVTDSKSPNMLSVVKQFIVLCVLYMLSNIFI